MKGGRAVAVFGASGFIGRHLADLLESGGERVIPFSRHPQAGRGRSSVGRLDLGGVGAVINLAGASIARRWTRRTWEEIVESRVGLTAEIVRAIGELPAGERPRVLLNASAVGIYPPSGDEMLRETCPPGTGRLASLCGDWEAAAQEAAVLGVRVVRLRTGIVLGRGGEAWERLYGLFRRGLGGRLGPGSQWMPWIHLEDEVRAIAFALRAEEVSGALNLSAPEPVTNARFTALLASRLGRRAILPAPGFALRAALGGFGAALLASQRVVPGRLLEAGFAFRFPTLEAALEDLCG